MKNLKKLAAFGAFLAATHAHAFETDFAPVQNSGEIEGIELFNGKLIVKSTGNIGGVPTQYMFLSTNTSNFAQSGFATTNMNNLTSMVFDENHIYATRENDTNHVYRFTVGNDNNLNGIKNDIKVYDVKDAFSVIGVKRGMFFVQNKEGTNTFAINAEGETIPHSSVTVPNEIATNYVHAVSNDGKIYFWDRTTFKKYIPESNTSIALASYEAFGSGEERPISMLSFDENNTFTLTNNGNLYQNPFNMERLMNCISGISYAPDGKSILMTLTTNNPSDKQMYAYDTEEESMTFHSFSIITRFETKYKKANGVWYTSINNKVGYSIAD